VNTRHLPVTDPLTPAPTVPDVPTRRKAAPCYETIPSPIFSVTRSQPKVHQKPLFSSGLLRPPSQQSPLDILPHRSTRQTKRPFSQEHYYDPRNLQIDCDGDRPPATASVFDSSRKIKSSTSIASDAKPPAAAASAFIQHRFVHVRAIAFRVAQPMPVAAQHLSHRRILLEPALATVVS
jgi:hypothetical protein